jgi:hypothetical protein
VEVPKALLVVKVNHLVVVKLLMQQQKIKVNAVHETVKEGVKSKVK